MPYICNVYAQMCADENISSFSVTNFIQSKLVYKYYYINSYKYCMYMPYIIIYSVLRITCYNPICTSIYITDPQSCNHSEHV